MITHYLRILSIACAALFITACASTEPAPTTLLTQAQAHISQAESAGADQHAPVALRDAKNQLKDAESAIDEEEYTKARMLLEKSIADSEYATAKSNSEKTQAAAEEMKKQMETLKQEVKR